MVKFREHRGSLADAMETVIEVKSLDELRKHLYKVMPYKRGALLKVEFYTYDERINWNTYLVTLDGNAVGYTNGELE